MCAVSAEWFLRRYFPEGGLIYRLHPRYHYTLAPGTRKLFRHATPNGGGRVLVTVNSRGFRGEELRSGPGLRVVVYGDSFIEAEFAAVPETFVRRLEVHLTAALGTPVEVVNAGVNGYGPDQSLRRFEDEVSWLQPRLAIFAVYAGNDFGDVLRNRLYRLDEAGALLDDDVVVVADSLRRELEEGEGRTPIHLLRGIKRLARGRRRAAEVREELLSVKLAKYVPRSIALCRQEYEETVVRGQSSVTGLIRDHYDADVSLEPGSPAARYKRALLEGVLGRLRDVTSAAGVAALVVVIPSPIDVCDAYDVRVDPASFPEYEPRRLDREAAAAAQRQGLAVVDLFEPLHAAGADRLYYHHGNDHWNAAGQDLAAQRVAERILAENWLGHAVRGASRAFP